MIVTPDQTIMYKHMYACARTIYLYFSARGVHSDTDGVPDPTTVPLDVNMSNITIL